MNNLKLRNIFVGLSVVLSMIMAFFPSESFIQADHFSVLGTVKQQHYNTIGPFEISPLKAAKFYYYQSSLCNWIDIRDKDDFNEQHLPFSENMSFNALRKSQWAPDRILLILGGDDQQVRRTVAMLRQEKNVRAFAVLGGYRYVKSVLADPVSFDLKATLSDEQLADLYTYREKLTGQKPAVKEENKTINTHPAAEAEDEGC